MADKEPRRRKKRRDSQKKDDVRHSEEQFFASLKSESRESDQEVEEETASHSHHGGQPSSLAKVVFVILFSGLIVALSFIFISLRDVDRGPVDIFDADHGGHHEEALHDEHLEEAIHDDHHHAEESEVTIDDFIPGLSSIFTLNNEVIKDISLEIPPEEEQQQQEGDKDEDDKSQDIEPESSMDQGILEEYIEDIPPASIEQPITEEPPSPEVYTESSTPVSHPEDIYSTVDYSESEDVTPSSIPDESELHSEPISTDEPEELPPMNTFVEEPEEILTTESSVNPPEDVSATDNSDDVEQDTFPLYEKADITNEMDYDIREDLDQLDDIVIKDSGNYIDDDEIGVDHHVDEDDEEEEEGVEEEFDFWQF